MCLMKLRPDFQASQDERAGRKSTLLPAIRYCLSTLLSLQTGAVPMYCLKFDGIFSAVYQHNTKQHLGLRHFPVAAAS